MNEPVLCYIEGGRAYFTTQALEKQWGDDWNDAPYEHNAGEPYEYNKSDAARGLEPWEIVEVRFDANDLAQPRDGHFNSRWSVEDINAKRIPWLTGNGVAIWAGTTIPEFKRLVREAGGKIYVVEQP